MKTNMKHSIFIVLILLCLDTVGQVGINEPNPDASSVLELKSNQRGFLMPRLTTLQAGSISAPATGLMLYNTDYAMPMVLDNSQATPKWAGLQPFLFHINSNETSTINVDIYTHSRVLDVGIGTNNPQGRLHVDGTIVAASGSFSGTVPPAGGLYVEGQARIDGGLDIAGTVGRVNTSLQQYQNGYYQTTFQGYGAVPIGAIIMWAGPVSQIPDGWVLYTPLADKFIVGAGSSSPSPGTTGGTHNQTLTVSNLPSHTHSVTLSGSTNNDGSHTHSTNAPNHLFDGCTYNTYAGGDGCADLASITGGSHSHGVTLSGTTQSTGSGSSFDNRPAYYVLCFIQRVK